jgi:NADP-dependent 3-hydroxy acid dehydrogenase YdfG
MHFFVLQELAQSLKSSPGKLHALKCDITKEAEVQSAFKWIKTNLGGVDILVNNAGVAKSSDLISTYRLPDINRSCFEANPINT